MNCRAKGREKPLAVSVTVDEQMAVEAVLADTLLPLMVTAPVFDDVAVSCIAVLRVPLRKSLAVWPSGITM